MTNQLKEAKKTAKLHGFTVNETELSSASSREYVVNGTYYTNSLPDAIVTGIAMTSGRIKTLPSYYIPIA